MKSPGSSLSAAPCAEVKPIFSIDAPPVIYWNNNPYSVDFSPDGNCLAIGSGGWYGQGGGITLVDLKTTQVHCSVRFGIDHSNRQEQFPEHHRPEETTAGVPSQDISKPFTASGVAFDGSGKFLAVCGWSSRQREEAPLFVFEVSRTGDTRNGTREDRPDLLQIRHRATIQPFYRGCATGLCLGSFRGELMVRCQSNSSTSIEYVHTGMRGLQPNPYQHRSESRIVQERGDLSGQDQVIVTGYGDSSLMTVEWKNGRSTTHLHSGAGTEHRITAVLVLAVSENGSKHGPKSHYLVTGHVDGSLVLWWKAPDQTRQESTTDRRTWKRLQHFQVGQPKKRVKGVLYCHYAPESIVALCALDDDKGIFFSADANGEILKWTINTTEESTEEVAVATRSYRLPRVGSPRCLAVHPSTPQGPLLAVGVKVSKSGQSGFVACFPVQRGWQYAGPWILMKDLIDKGRAIPKDCNVQQTSTNEGNSKSTASTVIHKLVTEIDLALFRNIISYIIP